MRPSLLQAAVLTLCAAAPCYGHDLQSLLSDAKGIQDWSVSLYKELHQIPELMYEEVETGKVIRKHLDKLKIPYKCARGTQRSTSVHPV